jgi:hypothetical protein
MPPEGYAARRLAGKKGSIGEPLVRTGKARVDVFSGDRGSQDPLELRVLPYLALALSVLPLLLAGFPAGHDWIFEFVRVSEYRAAVVSGQWPPYWGENLYGGYGSPVFLFYAPLFSAGAALLSGLFGSIARGATSLLVLISALSVWSVRRLLEEFLGAGTAAGRAAARLGTVFFVLHPYLLGDKLLRNADAEFLALALAPIALRGVVMAGTHPRVSFALISGGLALVVLSHNLTALVVVLSILGLGFAAPGRRGARGWAVILGGMAVGLLLSLFFWLPALSLTHLIRPEELLSGKFDFHRQFPAPWEIFGYGVFFAGGLATPLALTAGVALVLCDPARRRPAAALLGAAAILLFLMTRASTPVWEHVPMLPFFQFPWRMMGPLAGVACGLAAMAFAGALSSAPPSVRAGAEITLSAALVLNALPTLLQYAPLPSDVAVQLPAFLQPESIRRTGATVTVGDEYLPRDADAGAWRSQGRADGPVVSATGSVQWETVADAGTRINLVTRSSGPARLSLARWAFPGWKVRSNGAEGSPGSGPAGNLEVDVPSGEARMILMLEPPLVRRVTVWVSLAALVGWMTGLGAGSALRPCGADLPRSLPEAQRSANCHASESVLRSPASTLSKDKFEELQGCYSSRHA